MRFKLTILYANESNYSRNELINVILRHGAENIEIE